MSEKQTSGRGQRELRVRVKTAKGRKLSSTLWLERQLTEGLAAGRNLSADTRSHAALREIPECWAMGEAAGVAAVQALADRVELRDVDVDAVQAHLVRQGAIVSRPKRQAPADADLDDEFAESIHRNFLGNMGVGVSDQGL